MTTLPSRSSSSLPTDPRASSSFDSQRSAIADPNGQAEATPLVTDQNIPGSNTQTRKQGNLTFTNCLALVLGLQIGSGIFSAPSHVSNHVPSPGMAIVVWLLSGILVWTGAASFIELGLVIPRNGGVQEYLRVCYGEFMGFLFSWVWVAIVKGCSNATIGIVFAENVAIAFASHGILPAWQLKVIAILAILFITSVNCLGSIAGARAANAFLLLKLLTVFSIAIIGIGVGMWKFSPGSPQSRPHWFADDPLRRNMGVWEKIGEYITAAFGALFCYGGWETVGFVAADMTHPARDLPRVLNTAMAVAVSGFVFMNIALFMVLPFEQMRQKSFVAVNFGLQLFGLPGGLIYSLAVSLVCLGALNANVFALGRLCVTASKSGYFPKVIGNGHCISREGDAPYTRKSLQWFPSFLTSGIYWFAEKTEYLRWDKHVPIYAMMVNASIASFYVVLGSFDSLVKFFGISEYLFFLLAVLGLFMLRRRGGKALSDRSYRTATFNPVIFCIVSSLIVIRGVITDPLQGLSILTLTLVGWVVFRFKSR